MPYFSGSVRQPKTKQVTHLTDDERKIFTDTLSSKQLGILNYLVHNEYSAAQFYRYNSGWKGPSTLWELLRDFEGQSKTNDQFVDTLIRLQPGQDRDRCAFNVIRYLFTSLLIGAKCESLFRASRDKDLKFGKMVPYHIIPNQSSTITITSAYSMFMIHPAERGTGLGYKFIKFTMPTLNDFCKLPEIAGTTDFVIVNKLPMTASILGSDKKVLFKLSITSEDLGPLLINQLVKETE